MDLAILDAQELEAIRSALGQSVSAPSRTSTSVAEENATPVALIADDRSAERARPHGLKLAQRWAQSARVRLMRLAGVKLDIDGSSAEIVDARSLKEQLGGCWTRGVVVKGRPGRGLIAASGPMIEGLAARLLGGIDASSANDRPPSATALRVFTPAGVLLATALAEAFQDEQMCEMQTTNDSAEEWRRAVGDSDIFIVATLTVSGGTAGRVRLVVPPDVLGLPPPELKVVPADPETIRTVLGEVPVEVRVDLGRATLTMSELADLKPGAVVLLDRAVGDPLPVYCADLLIGQGRALVSRGALAVKMIDPKLEEK